MSSASCAANDKGKSGSHLLPNLNPIPLGSNAGPFVISEKVSSVRRFCCRFRVLTGRVRKVPDGDSREASDDENALTKEAGGGESKSAAINRKRIVIKPITDERSRVGTYNKRKFGVIKKSMELSILCKCKIGTESPYGFVCIMLWFAQYDLHTSSS